MRRLFAALLFVACSHAEVPDFYGVRLGMVPRDVRDRFTPSGGSWANEAAKDDYAITWAPPANASHESPTRATFEFHMGSLVAVRADLPADAPFARGDALVVSKSTVLKRTPTNGTVHVDMLARDCPTHADEAKRLVGAP